MRTLAFWMAIAASAAAMAEGGDEALVEREAFSGWRLTIGPVMSPRVRVRVHGPRVVAPALPKPRSGQFGANGAVAADPSAGYVPREYADGYVRPDEGTENPDSMISGLTWNWGARDVGVQHVGEQMEFRTETARWTESSSLIESGAGSRCEGDRDVLLGVEAMGGWTFFNDGPFDFAVDAGFRFYGSGDLNAESKYGTSVTTTRNEYRYVDRYDASGWTENPRGPHEGSKGGPSRLIGAMPSRSEELAGTSSSTESYYSHASTKMDYTIWDLRLGPTVGWKALDRLTIRGGVYGLLGLVDARLLTEVNTSNGSRASKKSVCEAIFGMAAGLSAQFDVTQDIFLMGGIEYDWWSDAVSLKTGGAGADIRLSDFTVTLALGAQF